VGEPNTRARGFEARSASAFTHAAWFAAAMRQRASSTCWRLLMS